MAKADCLSQHNTHEFEVRICFCYQAISIIAITWIHRLELLCTGQYLRPAIVVSFVEQLCISLVVQAKKSLHWVTVPWSLLMCMHLEKMQC